DDETMRLGLSVRAIRPANRLEQGMVSQRLIEIHHLKDRCVKASEQLRGDNEDLQRIGRIAKPIEELLLSFTVAAVGPGDVLPAVDGHYDVRHLRRQVFVERLLVQHATLAVEGHNLATEAVRRNFLLIVRSNIRTYPLYPFRGLHEDRHLGGGLSKPVAIQ